LFYLQEKAECRQQSKPFEQEINKNVDAKPSAYPYSGREENKEGLCLHQVPESRPGD